MDGQDTRRWQTGMVKRSKGMSSPNSYHDGGEEEEEEEEGAWKRNGREELEIEGSWRDEKRSRENGREGRKEKSRRGERWEMN